MCMSSFRTIFFSAAASTRSWAATSGELAPGLRPAAASSSLSLVEVFMMLTLPLIWQGRRSCEVYAIAGMNPEMRRAEL
ncbi:hypothetical protein LZ30DRAFT_240066 [Colletotrichum cereale]|nr:hypothetical protein LZ30DRAFT_240066 [Colletotrichum cereale]